MATCGGEPGSIHPEGVEDKGRISVLVVQKLSQEVFHFHIVVGAADTKASGILHSCSGYRIESGDERAHIRVHGSVPLKV